MVPYAANLRRSFWYASTVIHLTLLLSHVHTSITASFLNRGSVQFFTSIKQSCILYNFLVLIWLPKKILYYFESKFHTNWLPEYNSSNGYLSTVEKWNAHLYPSSHDKSFRAIYPFLCVCTYLTSRIPYILPDFVLQASCYYHKTTLYLAKS